MDPYANPFEHLRDELKRLKVLLERAVLVNRARDGHSSGGPLAGHVVEPAQVDAILASEDLLAARFEIPPIDAALAERIDGLDDRASELRTEIDQRIEASTLKGVRLPLHRLIEEFDLEILDLEILLLAIAPELDPAFEKIFAELHDDVTRQRPSVDLALQVLCRNETEKIRARTHLSPGALLLHYRFLSLAEDRQGGHSTLLNRVLVPDDSVVRYLIGQPPGVLAAGRFVAASPESARRLSASTREQVERFANAVIRHDPDDFTLIFEGDRPDMLLSAAVGAAHALQRPLLYLDASAEPPTEGSVRVALRDAALWDAILTVRMHSLERGEKDGQREAARPQVIWPATIAFNRHPVMLLMAPGQLPAIPSHGVVWRILVEPPEFDERLDLWKQASPDLSDVDARFLADGFHFSDDQVRSVQALAYGRASLRDASNPVIEGRDLLEASRELATPNLSRYAIPLKPRYTWRDIVLPVSRMAQLHSIADRMKSRSVVLRDWDFGAKHTRGNGLNVLFTGGSGTGKTMAAEVLATELSLTLFQIDLSSVVSKYVGETEKHLCTIFDEAQLGNVLLFIDEADSLLGKRTELKDAHDRYANIEVNYLLQRIDRYNGLCICATNMQKNMDDAFMCRLQHVVDFPFPSEHSRLLIWKRHLPAKAPKDPDIDFDYLSRRFKLPAETSAMPPATLPISPPRKDRRSA